MKERPILFSGPMVRAILDGRKTQTRRILKGSTEHKGPYNPDYLEVHKNSPGWASICPYGSPGDRLWVKETFGEYVQDIGDVRQDRWYVFRADDNGRPMDNGGEMPWKPSIFMPRRASRLTLEITGVRIERLNDISEVDAVAEGISVLPLQDAGDPSAWWQSAPGENQERTPVASYASLWRSINGPGSWAANPWVWVVKFRKIDTYGGGPVVHETPEVLAQFQAAKDGKL